MLNQGEVEQNKGHEIFARLRIILHLFDKLDKSFTTHLFNNESLNSINTNSNVVNTLSLEKSDTGEHSIVEINNLLNHLYFGNLIPLTCGHNGNYNETELHFIRYQLLKAKFI